MELTRLYRYFTRAERLLWLGSALVVTVFYALFDGDNPLTLLASLLGVYVGWRIAGVWGMLLFPLLLMALIRLNERGVLQLWRSVE